MNLILSESHIIGPICLLTFESHIIGPIWIASISVYCSNNLNCSVLFKNSYLRSQILLLTAC